MAPSVEPGYVSFDPAEFGTEFEASYGEEMFPGPLQIFKSPSYWQNALMPGYVPLHGKLSWKGKMLTFLAGSIGPTAITLACQVVYQTGLVRYSLLLSLWVSFVSI